MRSHIRRLTDIVEAIDRIREALKDTPLEGLEADWPRQWLVERCVEIISGASRHLSEEMKARHPEIPWRKVAGIGIVLHDNYARIPALYIWKLAQDDLPALERVCREELNTAQKRASRE